MAVNYFSLQKNIWGKSAVNQYLTSQRTPKAFLKRTIASFRQPPENQCFALSTIITSCFFFFFWKKHTCSLISSAVTSFFLEKPLLDSCGRHYNLCSSKTIFKNAPSNNCSSGAVLRSRICGHRSEHRRGSFPRHRGDIPPSSSLSLRRSV